MLSTTQTALLSLSPLDGRYSKKLSSLSVLFSDFALTKNRVLVEIEYVLFLAQKKLIPRFTSAQIKRLKLMVENFSVEDAEAVLLIEKETQHDVKAVEYFVRRHFKKHRVPNEEYVHLALTSEDTNALAYGLMLKQALQEVLIPELLLILQAVADFSQKNKAVPMLARTHGQMAIPTTVGKEIAVFSQRLLSEVEYLITVEVEGKMTGAVGNLSAHTLAFIDESPLQLSSEFVESLGLKPNLVTTQILPPENYTRIFSSLVRINGIMLDLSQDCWRYISDGYFGQEVDHGQVGSSTMPQKINPIDFENCEGNLGLANSLFNHFIQKLPVSRLQRDLSDSTVKRSFGSALGYCLLAYQSLQKGLAKVEVRQERLLSELLEHWEVLAEAYQIVLRRNNVSDGFEQLKALTQGKQLTELDARAWVGDVFADRKVKQELASLTPLNYLGVAVEITEDVTRRIAVFLKGQHERA
ncbi:adenylosuccinate lyase [Candidatus Woesebacteria bacterium]|nr:adenylosuccinate lyase [Candidatus Woesebacteria bacterium]